MMSKRRDFLKTVGAASAFAAMPSAFAAKKKKGPNFVVILADDIGFEEFGAYKVLDGPSNTPNIDALGERGVTFETAWGQAICGPSRAQFYSGNYACHTGS